MKKFVCLLAVLLAGAPVAAEELWPAFTDWPSQGGGSDDAAVIVGIENYAVVPPVGGAVANANDWMQYFTESRRIPAERVTLLRNNEGTLEKMKKFAEQASKDVRPGGTLWFVFIGHGAPARDGKDGVLVGFDAQQDVDSLYARSLAKKELLAILERGPQAKTVAVIDACFSGRAGGKALVEGLQPLLPVASVEPAGRSLVMTAGTSNEFAGPLPGAARPAFSYLVLGGLRGWADTDRNEKVTAGEAVDYAKKALRATVKDRSQTPELSGDVAYALTGDAEEKGPELSKIMLRLGGSGAGGGASEVKFGNGVIAMAPKIDVRSAGGDFVNTNIDAERAYENAVLLDGAPDTPPDAKSDAWCRLAGITTGNPYLSGATEACTQWKSYVQNRNTTLASLGGDYGKLREYLTLKLKTREQRLAAADAYLAAYATFAEEERVQNVANARVELDSASTDEDARDIALPEVEGSTSGGSSDWEFELDLGGVEFFYGSDDSDSVMAHTLLLGGFEPFGDGDFSGNTSIYSYRAIGQGGNVPLEYMLGIGYMSGKYTPPSVAGIDPTTGAPTVPGHGTTALSTETTEWAGLEMAAGVGLNLVSAPSVYESEVSLLNLTSGLMWEGVAGAMVHDQAMPWTGGLGIYAAETMFLGCSFAARAEYYLAIGHADVIPSHLNLAVMIVAEHPDC